MLYICIFGNKFDLKQTIRVLHTGGQQFDGPRSVTKYDKKWIKSFTDWQHKKTATTTLPFEKTEECESTTTWRATGTRICVFTVSASTTDRRLQNQNPGWTTLYGQSRKKILAKTIHGWKWYSRTRTDLTNLSSQELRHTPARKQFGADPDPTQFVPGLINDM